MDFHQAHDYLTTLHFILQYRIYNTDWRRNVEITGKILLGS